MSYRDARGPRRLRARPDVPGAESWKLPAAAAPAGTAVCGPGTRRFLKLDKTGRFNSVYEVWQRSDPAGEVVEHFLEDVLERSGAPI